MVIRHTLNPGTNSLHRLKSPILESPAVVHGMFTRNGGVSKNSYCSLNVSFGVGDKPENIRKNRRLLKKILGLDYLVSAKQTHGDRIFTIRKTSENKEVNDYDALVTNQPGVGLMIQQADCQAVLLHDPDRKVVAAVHVGWRGSVANIIGKTIKLMQTGFGTLPKNLRAVVSPSLGPCCAEFTNYQRELPSPFHRFQTTAHHFNFWEISRHQLLDAGVVEEHLGLTGLCTMCNPDFFSYRRSAKNGKSSTGRNGSIIALAQK